MPGVRTRTYNETKYQKPRLGFYARIFERVMRPLKKGRLNVFLPDGGCLRYGSGRDGVIANISVNSNDFFRRCILFGDVGFGESFVHGEWNSDDLTKVIEWMVINVEDHPTLMDDRKKRSGINWLKAANNLLSLFRQNTQKGSRKNIEEHYDLGNAFYKQILDPSMTYSSAYFKAEGEDLQQAQMNKYEQLAMKLRLKESDHLLEIGAGWGGFAVYAAKNFGCRVTSVTISKEQYEYASGRVVDERLSDRVQILYKDYRDLEGKYDKIVSIEMIEAVGHQFYTTYFKKIHGLLKKDGLLALQMILSPDHRYESFRKNMDFIQKHIFPGSLLPSMSVIQRSINETGDLNLLDYEDMTAHYTKTLELWRKNFFANLEQIREQGFDEVFIRKWHYYWCYCEAAFATRNIYVAQAVFSRPNNPNI